MLNYSIHSAGDQIISILIEPLNKPREIKCHIMDNMNNLNTVNNK